MAAAGDWFERNGLWLAGLGLIFLNGLSILVQQAWYPVAFWGGVVFFVLGVVFRIFNISD